jgi:hypothetical protein
MSHHALATYLSCLLLAGCGSSNTSASDLALADLVLADQGGQEMGLDAAPDAAPDDVSVETSPPLDLSLADGPADGLVDGPVVSPDLAPSTLSGCIQGTFTPYHGNLHAHTSYSDGKQTPADAFKYARDVAKLDIMVVTDHLEQLYFPAPLDRYGKCKSQAAAEQKAGTFIAACGFEYGSAFTPSLTSAGHANVFFSPNLFPAIQLNFRDFHKTLAACTTCIGQINHPGSEKDQHFNNFEYSASADARLTLYEFNSSPAWKLYFKALDAGWHLSPTYNQDNHSADWGTKNDNRTGLYMAALDLASMQKATLERRTFMTKDKNASIKMTAGSCWMGSILSGATGLTLSVVAADADSTDSYSSIVLYGKGQQQLAAFNCNGSSPCSASFNVLASQSPYFVARATQTDGDLLVAAPIWLKP